MTGASNNVESGGHFSLSDPFDVAHARANPQCGLAPCGAFSRTCHKRARARTNVPQKCVHTHAHAHSHISVTNFENHSNQRGKFRQRRWQEDCTENTLTTKASMHAASSEQFATRCSCSTTHSNQYLHLHHNASRQSTFCSDLCTSKADWT